MTEVTRTNLLLELGRAGVPIGTEALVDRLAWPHQVTGRKRTKLVMRAETLLHRMRERGEVDYSDRDGWSPVVVKA